MEYAIRQSAAIVREGVEVHFLCKASFPVERLGAGIFVERFEESPLASASRVEGLNMSWIIDHGCCEKYENDQGAKLDQNLP